MSLLKTSEVKINFTVHGLGFPTGKILKLHVWLPDGIKSPTQWVDNNADIIRKELRDICHVHSIQHNCVMWTNSKKNTEEYGNIILDSEKNASPSNDTKTKAKTVEVKPLTDIRKIDLPNIDIKDLNKLKSKIDIEIFKRDNDLSDDVYDFYYVNEDLVTVDQAKNICKKHGSSDLFFLRKREIRKHIKKKTPII